MAYGMSIRTDAGQFVASPDVTPLLLAQVIDYAVPSGGNVQIQTNIPNGINCIVFQRASVAGCGCFLSVVNGSVNKVISIGNASPTASPTFTVRFYVFANIVLKRPSVGIVFYKNGVCIYSGRSLPLRLLRGSTQSNPGVPCAVVGGYLDYQFQPTSPGNNFIGVDTIFGLCASNAGIERGAIIVRNTSSGMALSPPVMSNYLYIETSFYDAYYQNSLS